MTLKGSIPDECVQFLTVENAPHGDEVGFEVKDPAGEGLACLKRNFGKNKTCTPAMDCKPLEGLPNTTISLKDDETKDCEVIHSWKKCGLKDKTNKVVQHVNSNEQEAERTARLEKEKKEKKAALSSCFTGNCITTQEKLEEQKAIHDMLAAEGILNEREIQTNLKRFENVEKRLEKSKLDELLRKATTARLEDLPSILEELLAYADQNDKPEVTKAVGIAVAKILERQLAAKLYDQAEETLNALEPVASGRNDHRALQDSKNGIETLRLEALAQQGLSDDFLHRHADLLRKVETRSHEACSAGDHQNCSKLTAAAHKVRELGTHAETVENQKRQTQGLLQYKAWSTTVTAWVVDIHSILCSVAITISLSTPVSTAGTHSVVMLPSPHSSVATA